METFWKPGRVLFTVALWLSVVFAAPAGAASLEAEPEYQWTAAMVRAPQAWDLGADGSGIIVAVIDTGVDFSHPELAARVVAGYNAIKSSTALKDMEDDHGHGTMIAGIIAAERNNIAPVGVAHMAAVMPIKAVSSSGSGDDRDIAAGIVWAVEHGARIINLSIASTAQSPELTEALRYAAEKGCLIVAATGNLPNTAENVLGTVEQDQEGVGYPAADPHVVAVTALTREERIADFSLTGAEVLLSAPGDTVLTTYPTYLGTGGGLAYTKGTSVAAALVSGAAALIWSEFPEATAAEVMLALTSSARDKGRVGRDEEYGYGVLDVYRALQSLKPQVLYHAPAVLNWSGGTVASGDDAVVAIPPGAFNLAVDPSGTVEAALPVNIAPTTEASLYVGGVEGLGVAYSVAWEGQPPQKAITLTLPLGSDAPGAGIAYIYRLQGSRWVKVGGGAAAVPGGSVSAGLFAPGIYQVGVVRQSLPVDRVAGLDRIQTALATAREAFPQGTDSVVIARADDFPDALAGVPLAYKLQAPLLLTFPDSLPPEVLDVIQTLSPLNIYILGGEGAVSVSVARQLAGIAPITRLYGGDRFETAAAVARLLGTRGQAVIVNGRNFPDAVSIAAEAAQAGWPILLTERDELPEVTARALRNLSVTRTIIVGGPGVVSAELENTLPAPTRLAGDNRYDTSASVLYAHLPTGANLYIATGRNFPDALTGGLLAALNSSSIMLVSPDGLTARQKSLLSTLRGKQAVALGGTGSVSEELLAEVKRRLE
ncbi:MAG: S8 family serine peptidase [Gracilibacteraceae bacterium]|jgi:type VII secretion-associated serine protease mycosin|nr:S8 family serine peptidase [Gracilibacteraceae bacterium]